MSNLSEDPSVLGAGCGTAPLPTEGEYKAAFRRAFIARMAECGIPDDMADREFDAAPWDDIKEMDPALAADVAMEVWDVE